MVSKEQTVGAQQLGGERLGAKKGNKQINSF